MLRCIVILFFIFSSFSFSQNIVGVVKDANTNEPIVYANVLIKGTRRVVVTDEQGRFTFKKAPLGKQTLLVKLTGFNEKQQVVNVSRHRNKRVTILMSEDVQSLGDVTVNAKTESQRRREAPIKMAVLDLKKIESRPTPITELINQESGVKVRQASGVGSDVVININGMQGRAVRFFKDGIPMNYMGRAFSLGVIPVDQLASLEIYKGMLPASLGTDALGGALNFTTKSPDKNQGSVSYLLGSFNNHQINATGYLKIPKTAIYAAPSGYYISADNDYGITAPVMNQVTRQNEDKKVKRFHDGIKTYYVSIKIGVKDVKFADLLELEAGYFNREKEVQHRLSFSDPAGEAMDYEVNKILSLRYKKHFVNFTADVFGAYSYLHNKMVDTTSNIYSWEGKVTGQRTTGGELVSSTKVLMNLYYDNIVGRVLLNYDFNANHSIILSHNYTDIRRNGSASPGPRTWGDDPKDPLEAPTKYLKNVTGLGYRSSFFDGFLKNELTLKHYMFDGRAGSMWDMDDDFINTTFTGYGNALKISLNKDRFFRVSYERTLRIPESEEYFGDGMLIIANPDLKPEKSHNYNVGFYTYLGSEKRFWLDINAFYRDTEDLIILQGLGWIHARYDNSDNAIIKGAELGFKWNFLEGATFKLSATYQDLRRITPAKENALYQSRIPYIPYLFGNSGISKTFSNMFSKDHWLHCDIDVYANYTYTHSYMLNAVAKVNEPQLFEEIDDKALYIPTQHQVDTGIGFKMHQTPLRFNVELNNILNAELYDQFRVQRPPFNVRFKVSYNF